MIDIRIETFIAVCDYMNFTHAAEALNLTQPAVSRQMKSLEEYYDVQLFRYEGKKMYLTEAGKKLIKAARTAQADEKRLKNELKNQSIKKICFGSTPTPAEFMLPQKISQYFSNKSFYEIHMVVGNTEFLLDKLDRGEIDFAVVEGNFPKDDYNYINFSTQKYFPVCSYKLKTENCSIENITNETIIIREKGSGNRDILEHSLHRHNINILDFKKRIEVNNINVQKALVKQGCGIAFLFEAVVLEELNNGTIKKIDIEGFPVNHTINFVTRKNSIFNDEIEKAKEFLCI